MKICDWLKLLHKAVVLQGNCPSMLLQSRKVAPHSCSPKLLFKIATESRVPKKLPKTPMLLPEAASKLVRKAAQRCSPKLLAKAVPRRCSPKLCPKAVLQSCCPKAAILSTCSPKRLPKAILQSGSRKLRPKVAKPTPESCFRKRLPKVFF